MNMGFNNLRLKFEQNMFMECRDMSCERNLFNTCISASSGICRLSHISMDMVFNNLQLIRSVSAELCAVHLKF